MLISDFKCAGAFLIPYILSVVVITLPLFFAESALGQLTSKGVLKAWTIIPLMKGACLFFERRPISFKWTILFSGIGHTCIMIMYNSNTYYMVLLAWALRYVIASCSATLPWTTCENWWNTENCHVYIGRNLSENLSEKFQNSTVASNYNRVSSVQEYWEYDFCHFLKISIQLYMEHIAIAHSLYFI